MPRVSTDAPSSPTGKPPIERTHPPDALVRVINPVMRRVLTSPAHGLVSAELMLLRYEGRRSGRRFELPVGRRSYEGLPAVFTNSKWRHNFRGGRDAELVEYGRPRPVRGRLVEDVDTVANAYERVIGELGWKPAQRRLGITINVGRDPTHDELADAIRTSGLSIVVFDPR